MTRFMMDCDAVVALVCTDRGRHREQLIEPIQRDDKRRWSGMAENEFGTAKEAHDAVLGDLLRMGVPLSGKLVERDGKLDSRHRGGVRNTRHGTQVECPKCHRRRQFPSATLYRGLDVLVERGESKLDISRA